MTFVDDCAFTNGQPPVASSSKPNSAAAKARNDAFVAASNRAATLPPSLPARPARRPNIVNGVRQRDPPRGPKGNYQRQHQGDSWSGDEDFAPHEDVFARINARVYRPADQGSSRGRNGPSGGRRSPSPVPVRERARYDGPSNRYRPPPPPMRRRSRSPSPPRRPPPLADRLGLPARPRQGPPAPDPMDPGRSGDRISINIRGRGRGGSNGPSMRGRGGGRNRSPSPVRRGPPSQPRYRGGYV